MSCMNSVLSHEKNIKIQGYAPTRCYFCGEIVGFLNAGPVRPELYNEQLSLSSIAFRKNIYINLH